MSFLDSIIFYFLTAFIGASLLRFIEYKTKRYFEIPEPQREILNQKLVVYKELYLHTVASPLGFSVESDLCDEYLNKFCIKVQTSEELFLLLSPKCLALLKEYKGILTSKNFHEDIKKTRIELKATIEYDFFLIKEKLGYANELKLKRNVEFSFTISVLLILWIIYVLCMKATSPDKFSADIWSIYVLSCSFAILLILFFFSYYFRNKALIRRRRATNRQ